MNTYYAPTRAFSPIDALNRRAAAIGSPRYVDLASYADYNGHAVTVSWNSYRGYYVTEYTWNGRNVLARGSFAECLDAAEREYKRGALGANITVTLREGDTEADTLCRAHGLLDGREDTLTWWTWRHTAASQSARDYAVPGALTLKFDWALMQAAGSRDEYLAALRGKYGNEYTF